MTEEQLKALKTAKQLFDEGVLAEDEFLRTKQQILSKKSKDFHSVEDSPNEKRKTYLIISTVLATVLIVTMAAMIGKKVSTVKEKPYTSTRAFNKALKNETDGRIAATLLLNRWLYLNQKHKYNSDMANLFADAILFGSRSAPTVFSAEEFVDFWKGFSSKDLWFNDKMITYHLDKMAMFHVIDFNLSISNKSGVIDTAARMYISVSGSSGQWKIVEMRDGPWEDTQIWPQSSSYDYGIGSYPGGLDDDGPGDVWDGGYGANGAAGDGWEFNDW